MERLLRLNPEFTEDAKFLEKIRKKVVFKGMGGLDGYLTVIKLGTLKKLLSRDFYGSERLRKVYKQIIESESSGPEKMIFKILSGEKVQFSDIRLKFLFYKEFPEKRSLFVNDSNDPNFEVADLLFRKVYLHEDTSYRLQELIASHPVPSVVFYFISLGDILDCNYIRNTLSSMKSTAGEDCLNYWALGLTCLPEKEFYTTLSSELMYSTFIDKIKIYRCVEDLADTERLCVCLLEECMKNALLIGKMYATFLKLIEMFDLSYQFKLKLLYSWMRYFLHEGHVELFFELLKNVKKARKLDEEIGFYEAMGMLLRGQTDMVHVKDIATTLKDEGIVRYSFDEIISKYEK